MKHIFQFFLNNDWNKFEYARVQSFTSLGLEVKSQILSTEKNNNLLKIFIG